MQQSQRCTWMCPRCPISRLRQLFAGDELRRGWRVCAGFPDLAPLRKQSGRVVVCELPRSGGDRLSFHEGNEATGSYLICERHLYAAVRQLSSQVPGLTAMPWGARLVLLPPSQFALNLSALPCRHLRIPAFHVREAVRRVHPDNMANSIARNAPISAMEKCCPATKCPQSPCPVRA
jgi:hypothetical protein